MVVFFAHLDSGGLITWCAVQTIWLERYSFVISSKFAIENMERAIVLICNFENSKQEL